MKKPIVISNTGTFEERARGDSLLVPFSFFDHFIGNTLNAAFANSTSGGGNSVAISQTEIVEGQLGTARLRTGGGGTAGIVLRTGSNDFRFSNQYGLRVICGAALPVLSNGTNRYSIRLGMKNTPTTLSDGTGIYVRYTDTLNGGNFQGVIRNGGTETVVNYSVGPVANTPFIVGFEVATNYTSVEFFSIDQNGNKIVQGSSSLGGASTPPVSTLAGLIMSIQKSVGGSNMHMLVDFIQSEVF